MNELMHEINHSPVWGFVLKSTILLALLIVWGMKMTLLIGGLLLYVMLKQR